MAPVPKNGLLRPCRAVGHDVLHTAQATVRGASRLVVGRPAASFAGCGPGVPSRSERQLAREVSSMTVGPAHHGAPAHSGLTQSHERLGAWSVTLAALVAVVVAAAYAVFGVALAVGGQDAVSDTWVGYLAGIALIAGLLVSLAAFAMAVVVKVRHESRRLLWLPLAVFPVLLATVVLVELIVME